MRKFPKLKLTICICAVMVLFFGSGAFPQVQQEKIKKATTHQLHIDGDTVTIIKSLPFRIVCKDEAKIYFWDFPSNWKVTGQFTETLIVNNASKGTYSVTVATISKDWERNIHSIEVNIGESGPGPDPGPDPGPGPEPNDPLFLSLKTASVNEDKAKIITLGELYILAADKLVNDPSVVTNTDLLIKMSDARKVAIGDTLLPIRRVIGDHLNTILPRATDTKLTVQHRQAASQAFNKIGNYLKIIGN